MFGAGSYDSKPRSEIRCRLATSSSSAPQEDNMKFEEFNNLSEEEKKAYFDTIEENDKKMSEQSAEITSLKKELEENRLTIEEGKKDLAATKELNYTLARKINLQKDQKSFEETLHEAFGKGGKNDN